MESGKSMLKLSGKQQLKRYKQSTHTMDDDAYVVEHIKLGCFEDYKYRYIQS